MIQIDIPKEKLSVFCKKNHIKKLSFFGSILRNDFRPDSDIDVLVEFEDGHSVGFIKLYEIEHELSNLLGTHQIDLVTPKFLNKRIRSQILSQAEVQYAA